MIYQISVGQNKYNIEIASVRDGVALVNVNSKLYEVVISNFAEVTTGIAAVAPPAAPAQVFQQPAAQPAAPQPVAPAPQPQAAAPAAAPSAGGATVTAPVPGLIIEINVKVGDRVAADQVVVTMEAMKMLTEITAPKDGVVTNISVQAGAQVDTDDVLVIID